MRLIKIYKLSRMLLQSTNGSGCQRLRLVGQRVSFTGQQHLPQEKKPPPTFSLRKANCTTPALGPALLLSCMKYQSCSSIASNKASLGSEVKHEHTKKCK